ncbi:valine--tRNA ligase [Candidatus Pacearchaeota archaeon]|nr:valine--tRNA ligase [Candidatus Pacearchaeota archaeon]
MTLKNIKSWNPSIEREITEKWKKSEFYFFDKKSKKRIYSIDTPPPYINAPIHIGQAITYCYIDMFARYRRMKGFQVIFPLGLDRNGLPIEMGAEKKFGISPFEVGRKKFLEYCNKLLEETSNETIDTFAKLGISFTSYKQGNSIGSVYLTDSSEYRALTQSTFIELYKKGLIYEDRRISNWDSKLRTTIADSEIEYKDIPSTFNNIVWTVKETGEKIIIGTTRPELICTCARVIFNPEDKRYQHLKNKTALSPLFNKEIPIMPHSLAKIEKGTGLAMMCSAGDLSDIQFFREHNLTPLIAINSDGTLNEHAEFLKGLKIKQAREKILEILKEKGLLVSQKKIMHRTPISERSKTEVEFIEMPELYIKQLEFKNAIRAIANKINFYPKESKKILENWIDSISIDWPISRRRFYATEIPLWYAEKDGKKLIAIPKPGKYYQPWKESVLLDASVYEENKFTGKRVKDFKELKWIGEERVFDTWMDSSISELFILNYSKDRAFFKKAFPAKLRPQGKEIVRTWLYYTLLRGYLETKKPCFEDVWIHQHVLDEKGRKMSKSLGNVIDPQELIQNFGAEAIRFWAVIEGDLSKQDLICSKEKIQAELKTLTKILNLSKFVLFFEKPKKKPPLCKTDKLFIDYMEFMGNRFDKFYEKYDFYHPALELRNFIWDIFASHYVEMVKARAYNEKNLFSKEESESAKYTLHYLLENFLILIYPIIPQISTLIAEEKGMNLLNITLPKFSKRKFNFKMLKELMNFNSFVWKKKQEENKTFRDSIRLTVPKILEYYKKDLIAMHNII